MDDRSLLVWIREVTEETNACSDRVALKSLVLRHLQRIAPFETSTWTSFDALPDAVADVSGTSREDYVRNSHEYERELGARPAIALSKGGVAVAEDLFTMGERDRFRYFAELMRPSKISNHVIMLGVAQGHRAYAVTLERHGQTRRFSSTETESLAAISPVVSLLHALYTAHDMELATPVDPALAEFRRNLATLSPHERKVAELVRAGKRNAEIARERRISPHTVRNQLHMIFAKLGTSSRTELAVMLQKVCPQGVSQVHPRDVDLGSSLAAIGCLTPR